jgi:hypothetical protein
MATAAKKHRIARVDPELLRQLDDTSAGTKPVEAVFTLKPGRRSRTTPAGADTEAAVRRLLRRVETRVGVSPHDCNVFRNLEAFLVVAPPRFVRELMAQDEIATATANRQPRSMIIAPRGRRPA